MNVRTINSIKDNQFIECFALGRLLKTRDVLLHNSLEDIDIEDIEDFDQILHQTDFAAPNDVRRLFGGGLRQSWSSDPEFPGPG